MPDYDAVARKQNRLLRKALKGSVFIADFSADPIATLTDDSQTLRPFPDGYDDLGFMTGDGAQFDRATTTVDTTPWGSVGPAREDFSSDVDTVHVVAQETNALTLGLLAGLSLRGAVADENGEISFVKPVIPGSRYFRLIAVAVDFDDAGPIYIARFFPRAKLTNRGGQVFANNDDGVTYDLTFTAFADPVLGYSRKDYFGGPGWAALLGQMGFGGGPVAPPPGDTVSPVYYRAYYPSSY